ncbi:hypothetical protein ACM40_00595 [Chryseobacterium sp. BLS98]|nr:hypothetical protein ACM40_00595 [Chryseobacterium sp. BLS98]
MWDWFVKVKQKLLRKQVIPSLSILQNTHLQIIKTEIFLYKLFTPDFQMLQKILPELWLKETHKKSTL